MPTSPKNSGWRVELTEQAADDFRDLQKMTQLRIHKLLAEKLPLQKHPKDLAEPLTGSFSGKWRFRVGDYRLVCVFEEKTRTVYIQYIGHRREVYK